MLWNFPGRLGGDHRPRAARLQGVGIMKNRAKNIEFFGIGEVFELEGIFLRLQIGPCGENLEADRVADDKQGRVLQRGGVARELDHRLVEVSPALLILPGEIALLPNVRPAVAAARDRGAFFEGEVVAVGVVLGRRRVVEQPAQIQEMLLRRRALGQRMGFPFADEILRRHRRVVTKENRASSAWGAGNRSAARRDLRSSRERAQS